MKDPLVDYSSVCYPDMGAPGALHLPFCAPLGATLRSRVLPGVPASTSNADIPTGSGDLQDAWANQFCTIFLGLFLLKAGVHEKSHPTSNAPGDSGSREGSFTPSHQRTNVAPLQSSLPDPCQVISDQNQLLFALWSRSWFISDGDYISVGEHLS